MDTKRIVEELILKHNSNNPFIIADNLGITVLYSDMNNTLGFYSKYKRFKFIHLNQNMPEKLQTFVCGHELCHAIVHPNKNTPFLRRYILYSVDKLERQANTFAVELLLTDKILQEYPNCSLYNIARYVGVPEKLVDLKVLPTES